MLVLLGCMMVLYNFFDLYFPTGNCRMVKPRKLKPTFPLHSSFASRVWANRVFASLSSSPMPLSHSWIASLHRCMPSHVLWSKTKSSAYLIRVRSQGSNPWQTQIIALGGPLLSHFSLDPIAYLRYKTSIGLTL